MLLQNIRAKIGARLNGDREAGFTLIELLVVMLILGILAAIALPAFFNQKDKGTDAQAKAYAHSAQVAMETYSTDNGGTYDEVDSDALENIETTLSGATWGEVEGAGQTYSLTIVSGTGNEFTISRNAEGIATLSCEEPGDGGCPPSGLWGQ